MKDNQKGFLGSFLSKGLKTNQLEVNTDEKTQRPIARLKEPRDLFALPKDKDNDWPQQAPRWPIECQVIEQRIKHILNLPPQPEPFYQQTGNELKPIPVGEENGIVVFNYNPISAVNYDKTKKTRSKIHIPDDSSDSDEFSSCESQASTPDVAVLLEQDKKAQQTITNLLNSLEQRSSSNSNGEDDDDDNDNDEDDEEDEEDEKATDEEADKTLDGEEGGDKSEKSKSRKNHKSKKPIEQPLISEAEIDNIWADKSPEYMAATPTFIKTQIDKKMKAQQLNAIPPVRLNERLKAGLQVALSRSNASPNPNDNSPNDENKDLKNTSTSETSYQTIKANPLFNSDMSINLNELIKRPKTDVTTAQYINNSNRKLTAQSYKIYPNANTNTTNSPLLVTSYSPDEFNFQNVFSSSKSTRLSSTSDQDQNLCSNPYDNNDKKSNKYICLSQFSRSAVGGSKFLTNCHPYNPGEYNGLEFESRFESGNLAKAVQITPAYYELHLRPDLYTSRSKQWFYFRVKNTKKNMIYRFSIVNLIKSDSLYNEGMRPVMYSTIDAKTKKIGWRRCGDNVCYFRNDDDSQTSEDEEDNSSSTLTFNIEFEHDNDTVFFAHSYPYTYSDLQDYLMDIQKNPVKSKFCKLRLLCRTLAGNNVYYLTVTSAVANEEATKRKESIVVSARVHPSETPSSWMMKGLIDFITGDSVVAKRLRHKFIFKIIPMLNPDGVIVGNTRNSLTGKDLNRQYRTVIRETYPSIWYTKALIKRLIDDCGVSMYCDMHAHSRRHNIFIYGCENRRSAEKKLSEQVFPLMLHKNVADKFSFESCKFKVQRSKEGTGRIVVWMLGITNSYTIEASFGGSLLGSRKGTHFTIADYEHMGRAFCETLLDYCGENPTKVKRNAKLLKRIKKIRKREKREQKAIKLKKLADQGCIIEEKFKECLRLKIIERLLKEGSTADAPINIALSDYSSAEGSSSSSDNEGKSFKGFPHLEKLCCNPLKVPWSPELETEIRRFRYCRMRKVMQELDRIYFQPLFHKKCSFLIKKNHSTIKKRKRKIYQKETDSRQRAKDSSNSDSQPSNKEVDVVNTVTLRYVEPNVKSSGSSTSVDTLEKQETKKRENSAIAKREKGGQEIVKKKPLVKVSRKLRLWLKNRQIFIMRRKMHHKFKLRFKSLYNRKKGERIVYDMPTTDPGSDLIFSTDDENIDTNCYGTTLPRTRRHLLNSELQRRYIDEIGDGLRNMPPELIIASPSKKKIQKWQAVQKVYKPAATESYGRSSQRTNELPYIRQTAVRTSSWQNLNSAKPSMILYKPGAAKNKTQSPLYRPMSRKEILSKEDLNIKLSLKKKIWTGIQPDNISGGIDRTRPLSWMASHSVRGKKMMAEQNLSSDLNYVRYSSGNYIKTLENEANLSASNRKILEWQILDTKTDNSPYSPKLRVPDIKEDNNNTYKFKHFTNTKPYNDIGSVRKPKRTTIAKVVQTSKIFAKISKSRNNMLTSHRVPIKQPLNQHKSHVRSTKLKTGGLEVTAVQTIVTSSTSGGKKNKKQKSLQHKLPPHSNSCNTNSPENADRRRLLTYNKSSNDNNAGLVMAASATNIVRKVKTKLKKKKSSNVKCSL